METESDIFPLCGLVDRKKEWRALCKMCTFIVERCSRNIVSIGSLLDVIMLGATSFSLKVINRVFLLKLRNFLF